MMPRQTVTDVCHHLLCRHQVEIEVSPPQVELTFADERWSNPINSQCRFEAALYNSREGALWAVYDLDGSPGQGSIDGNGLYSAPDKGALPSGFTEVVVASAREDPLRRAHAFVTLLGVGPEPAAEPSVDVSPKRVNLYYPLGANNNYMDDCNKMRLFRAAVQDSANTATEWLVDGVLQAGTSPWFLYRLAGAGGTKVVTIRARLQSAPAIFDDALVQQLNYFWPGA